MLIKRRAIVLAHQKQTPKHTDSKNLGLIETARLRSLGKRDGHHGLPKQDETGVWTSPLLQKEVTAYNEFCIIIWGELQTKHEVKFKELANLFQEIPRIREQLDAQLRNAPPPPDLTERIKGEEMLSEYLIRSRRQREYEKRHSGYFNKLRQIEITLEESYQELSELLSAIQAAEKTVHLRCEQASEHALQRIAIYWSGVLRTHPRFKVIPPTPDICLEASAEAEYYSLNQSVQEEAQSILALSRHIQNDGKVVNSRRTEE